MVRRFAFALAMGIAAMAALAHDAGALGIRSPVPVVTHARLDLRLVADEATAPWSWDTQSRSPLDQSRFMADIALGDARTGTLYAKGAATWAEPERADGRVAFALEQGDYVYRTTHAELRAFGDERRFFTHDLGTAFMDDDVVDDYQHRIGVRTDGGTERAGGTLLLASLDQGADTRLVGYAKARTAWKPLAASLSYQVQEGNDARDHAVAKGEVAAFWKRASAIASYEQSGFGDGVFLPDVDMSGFGAEFVELRVARGGIGNAATFSSVYRYRRVKEFYQNNLSSLRARTLLHRLGLYLSHRHSALDGRLVVFSGESPADSSALPQEARGIEASARAFLKANSEMNLRGVLVDRTRDDGEERTTGVVHASYRRSLQQFMGGVDARVDEIGEDAVTRVGIEVRINWNATSALYLRWMATGALERSDAAYARLEFRPTARTWVTLAYGRATAGDGPYFVEDNDALPTTDTEDVFTLTVRGDF